MATHGGHGQTPVCTALHANLSRSYSETATTATALSHGCSGAVGPQACVSAYPGRLLVALVVNQAAATMVYPLWSRCKSGTCTRVHGSVLGSLRPCHRPGSAAAVGPTRLAEHPTQVGGQKMQLTKQPAPDPRTQQCVIMKFWGCTPRMHTHTAARLPARPAAAGHACVSPRLGASPGLSVPPAPLGIVRQHAHSTSHCTAQRSMNA